ncbi:hypothetical protein ScPMuIL_007120 [Solemya velum]
MKCSVDQGGNLTTLRSYIANHVNWANVIEEIKANLHQLPRPARDLYKTATRDQLRNILFSGIGKLIRKRPQDTEDADIRMAIVDLQRQEIRMRVGNRDNAPDNARVVLAENQSTSDEGPPEVEDDGLKRRDPMEFGRSGASSVMVPPLIYVAAADAEDSPLFSKTDGASQKKKKRVTFAVQLENVRPLVFDIAATVSEEAVLARHGPYLLTATDFRSLLDKNWLTDN